MEALYGERLSEHVERLADHALRGEAWQAAAEYGRQAGRKAMLRSANREAVSHFERALLALARLPGERRILEQAIDVRLELRPALNAIGEGERASQLLREAEAMAEALHDERRHGRTLSLLTFTYFDQGEHRRACEVGERALAIGRSLSDPIIQGVAAHLLTFPYRALGDFRRAVAASEAAVDDLDGRHGRERYGVTGYPAVASRSLAAGCLAELGEFDRARTYGEEAVRLAKALGHTYTHGAVQLILSYLHLRQGCAEAAIPLLEECLDIFERWDLPHLVPEARACLASAYALSGRLADGVRLMEQAASRIESARMGTLTPSVSVLADAYLLIGRIGPARQLVEPALDAARRHAERGYQADLLRVLGEFAAWGEPPAADHAEALLREALALAEELGMRPLQARCHLGLGKLYRRIGRAEDARAHLEQAVEMLRAMGMRRWLPEDEAELASVDAEARA
jgi:tetratricopeptide (TPR) repeat protein